MAAEPVKAKAANPQPKNTAANKPKKLPVRRDQEDDEEEINEEEDDDEEDSEEETKPMTRLQQLDLKISGKKPSIKTGASESSVSTSEVSAYDKVCLLGAPLLVAGF